MSCCSEIFIFICMNFSESDGSRLLSMAEISSSLSVEKTLAIIKPDSIADGFEESIRDDIRDAGFVIVAEKRIRLSADRASDFYSEHEGKPFFEKLVDFMTSGPCRVMVLAKENAVRDWRAMMGPTNVETARSEAPGSMRAKYGTDTTFNAVHGSDSSESARREIKFFFSNVSLPILEPADAREYMDVHLSTVLRLALTELCKQKPAKPKEWLAQWLLAHNPNKPNLEEQE